MIHAHCPWCDVDVKSHLDEGVIVRIWMHSYWRHRDRFGSDVDVDELESFWLSGAGFKIRGLRWVSFMPPEGVA